MIATILIVGAALVWLGYESDWLRINLCDTGAQFLEKTDEDCAFYDSEDYREMIGNLAEQIEAEVGYRKYLHDLYELKPATKQPAHGAMSIQDRLYAEANRSDNLAHFSHQQVELVR